MSDPVKVVVPEAIAQKRAAFRQAILTKHLLGESVPIIIRCHFDGGGGAGGVDLESAPKIDGIQEFLSDVLFEDTIVPYNWVKDEGGGGYMEWDVKEDKFLITGHMYYTASRPQPDIVF